MHQQILCDAAISLSTILTANALPHAFFGGFAILELCRSTTTTSSSTYRESKDIDCLVLSTKEAVLALMAEYPAYLEIPQNREDYVAFFWKHPTSEKGETVLVELFVGSKSSEKISTLAHPVNSQVFGPTTLPLVQVGSLFTGKLNACATRNKETDFIDLLFLVSCFPAEVKLAGKKVERKVVRDVVARWPGLRGVLESVGLRGSRSSSVEGARGRIMRGRFAGQVILGSGYLGGCIEKVVGVQRPSTVMQNRKVLEGEVQRGLGCAY